MHWIAPSDKDNNTAALEKRLWDTADQFRANSVRAAATKVSPFYGLDAINSDQRKQELLALAQGGATREALTKDTISNFRIVLPPRPLMQRYHDIAEGIHREREVLLHQIQNLRRTRDLLLPRLLSGQVKLAVASATESQT